MRAFVLAVAIASVHTGTALAVVAPARGVQDDAVAALEADADRALKSDDVPFAGRAVLVERLHRARGQSSGDARGRLALLWMRSVRWLLAAIPIDAPDDEPYRDWLASHELLVQYSEPAGAWLIVPDEIWRVHDEHRTSTAAESIAWLAVENGMPGECEGYVPCIAYTLDRLYGAYLRRHPRGAHAAEAARGIEQSCGQALELSSGADGSDFLDPARDCRDLGPHLDALREAVAGSGSAGGLSAIAAIDRLGAFCP